LRMKFCYFRNDQCFVRVLHRIGGVVGFHSR
jgi:hypothetical protein